MKDDGGPAFPLSIAVDSNGVMFDASEYGGQGMSLRDYAAIHAAADEFYMPTTVQECAAFLGIAAGDYDNAQHWNMVVAKARYDFADAMLKKRDEPQPA